MASRTSRSDLRGDAGQVADALGAGAGPDHRPPGQHPFFIARSRADRRHADPGHLPAPGCGRAPRTRSLTVYHRAPGLAGGLPGAHGRRRRHGRLVPQRAGAAGAAGRPRPGRGQRAAGSADPLLVAILGLWDTASWRAGAAAGLRADVRAGQPAPPPWWLPRWRRLRTRSVMGGCRCWTRPTACPARPSALFGTEHLVVAMLWGDSFIGPTSQRRLGVSDTMAAEQLPPCLTASGARSIRWRRWRCRPRRPWHPGRSTHRGRRASAPPPLALGPPAACRAGGDRAPRSTGSRAGRSSGSPDQQHEVIRGRFHAVNKELGRRGSRHVRQEPRRPGLVAGADPPRRVGPGPAWGARPPPRPRAVTSRR